MGTKELFMGLGLKGKENRRVAWNKVCEPKEKGGLWVIGIRRFNYALLGTWIWRLMPNESCF